MKIEGTYELEAHVDKVWQALLDPQQLRNVIPGCKELEVLGENEFSAVVEVGLTAVKGRFEGKFRFADRIRPVSYRIIGEGSGLPGFVNAEAFIALSSLPGGTRISYETEIRVGGPIAVVGQRILAGASKIIAGQFFHRLGQLLLLQ